MTITTAAPFSDNYASTLKKAVLTLRAINHPVRLQMLEYIITSGPLTVVDLCVRFRMEQPVVSGHLSILRRAGIIRYISRDKFHYYQINADRLAQVNRAVLMLCSNH